MTALSDDEIMELAGSWFYTGENQKRDDGYYYRSLGTPSNVRGSDLIEFARALLAAQPAVQQPSIPEGWGFSSADFSLQASGVSEFGGVMLIRTGADRADWHALTDEQREVIPLYVSGTGKTVAKAIASAAKNCTPLPTPPKD